MSKCQQVKLSKCKMSKCKKVKCKNNEMPLVTGRHHLFGPAERADGGERTSHVTLIIALFLYEPDPQY